MRHTLTLLTTLTTATVAFGQEVPNPNPVSQSDGTQIWYVGNNTQYPSIQAAIDDAGTGDEIVVRGGTYVESLELLKDGLTIRPFVTATTTIDDTVTPNQYTQTASFESVTFLNPTNGPSNDEGYAMKMVGANGTYVGRPRQFTELSNGLDVETEIRPRDPSNYSLINELETAGGAPTGLALKVKVSQLASRNVITFQSRSADDVAIWSSGGLGTFNGCSMTSMNGFGGGIMVTGADNQTNFVNCDVSGFFATGNTHAESGEPVCVVNITGDATTQPSFQNCTVSSNDASQYGIVYQNGAHCHWYHSDMKSNDARAADGTYMLENGSLDMTLCEFELNESGKGTVYVDMPTGASTSLLSRFTRCTFTNNSTVSTQDGGVIWVDHAAPAGTSLTPQVMFSDNTFSNNNGLGFPNPQDPISSALEADGDRAIYTPYVPEYRVGIDNGSAFTIPVTVPQINSDGGDVNGDGNIDSFDLIDLFEALGTCREDLDDSGEIDFNDLLNILVNFGNTCE